MLQSLRIRNLALLESVELEFEAGFTAVTGETGAGKSVLLGALSLLAGERADKGVVRQGAAACEVEAAVHLAEPRRVNGLLEDFDLPACEEGMLVLKRSIGARPGRISVNGSLATLAALQRLGEAWIDFHGPSEPRRLLKESCQLELLDLFGRTQAEFGAYREAYDAWQTARRERDALIGEARLSPDQVEFLKQQLRGFEAVDLSDEAVEALERDFQRMAGAQDITEVASTLAAGLAGEESGVQAKLAGLLREARRLAELDPASGGLAERLGAAAAELQELSAEFSALVEGLQFDAEAGEELTRRMNAWLELKRRYGPAAGDVRAARAAIARRLEGQTDVAGKLRELEERIAAAEKVARERARTLRVKREKAAGDLARSARKEIAGLGFAKAGFEVRVRAAAELGSSGDCAAEFLFAPNVGEEARPLAKIASSGELARVMLALKAILAEVDDVPVLVFDEVDANVGGEIGRVVGEKMAAIGRKRQVLCVTHLPQVAAQAANHFVVSKDQGRDRAVVAIKPIHSERKARVSEIARMLGDRQAKSALAHAEELLGR